MTSIDRVFVFVTIAIVIGAIAIVTGLDSIQTTEPTQQPETTIQQQAIKSLMKDTEKSKQPVIAEKILPASPSTDSGIGAEPLGTSEIPERETSPSLGDLGSETEVDTGFRQFNPDAIREDTPVWQIQITLPTGQAEDASTDDSIGVDLGFGTFWLDTPRDDWESKDSRGDIDSTDFTYLIPVSGITLSDIKYIKIVKADPSPYGELFGGDEGHDAWCVSRIELYVNKINTPIMNLDNNFLSNSWDPIFEYSFSNTPDGCAWIDDDPGFTNEIFIDSGTLRGSSSWKNWISGLPPTASFSGNDMVRQIEATMGDLIHDNRLHWSDKRQPGVDIHRISDDTIHVDIQMKVDIPEFFDPDADVSYDVEVRCLNGNVEFNTYNLDVSSDYSALPDWAEGMLQTVISWLAGIILGGDLDSWGELMGGMELGSDFYEEEVFPGSTGLEIPDSLQGVCPEIDIHPDGSMDFIYP